MERRNIKTTQYSWMIIVLLILVLIFIFFILRKDPPKEWRPFNRTYQGVKCHIGADIGENTSEISISFEGEASTTNDLLFRGQITIQQNEDILFYYPDCKTIEMSNCGWVVDDACSTDTSTLPGMCHFAALRFSKDRKEVMLYQCKDRPGPWDEENTVRFIAPASNHSEALEIYSLLLTPKG